MKLSRKVAVALGFSALAAGGPIDASPITNGTVSVASLFSPTVDLASNPYTIRASFGNTFEVSATDGFAMAQGQSGKDNGTLSFSNIMGTTIAQTIRDFFVFDDGQGGTYNFSVNGVTTANYQSNPGISNSVSLYLLGMTANTNLGNEATPTSLTMQFNNTGMSAYSSSQTLAVPPAADPPATAISEPISLALLGTSLIGMGLVRRRGL